MMRPRLISLTWPGLTRLWYGAELGGLAEAACFALWLNVALAISFTPDPLLGETWRGLCWLTLFVGWGVSIWRSHRWLKVQGQRLSGAAKAEDLFPQAQLKYLKKHWFEAEELLQQIIQIHPLDAEAHLMLATLYRHTQHREAAKTQLNRLARLETAGKWQLEIEQEWQQLEDLSGEMEAATAEAASTESTRQAA